MAYVPRNRAHAFFCALIDRGGIYTQLAMYLLHKTYHECDLGHGLETFSLGPAARAGCL